MIEHLLLHAFLCIIDRIASFIISSSAPHQLSTPASSIALFQHTSTFMRCALVLMDLYKLSIIVSLASSTASIDSRQSCFVFKATWTSPHSERETHLFQS